MGRRYQAILKYLGQPFYCNDLRWTEMPEALIKENVSGIIIATPTPTHATLIEKYAKFGKAILCEKPISTDLDEVKGILEMCSTLGIHFNMMLQYAQLVPKYARGESFYNYFRHGSDGLIWDCIQIIGLAKGNVRIDGDCPIWQCMINGHRLTLDQMDGAYMAFVEDWLKGARQDMGEIFAMHERTAEMACQK
jgi:hypothetical protein